MMIRLPWPHKFLSPNSREHWATVAREKNRARQAAFWIASEAMGRDWTAPDRPHVHLVFCPPDNKARDLDNLLASMKAALDGVSEAIGVDDSKWAITITKGDVVRFGAVLVAITDDAVSADYTALRDRMAGGDSGWKSVGDLARSIVGNHGGGK